MGTGPSAARATAERAVARTCARALPPEELLDEVARAVRRVLPYTAAGWMVTDPDTGLSTAVRGEQVHPEVQRRLIEHERTVADVNTFAALARRRRPAGRLSAATRGRLGDSPRHRDLYAPLGLGDELRAVFRAGGRVWGQACLARSAEDPWFDAADERFLAGVAGTLGDALRQAHALARAQPPGEETAETGVLLLGADGGVRARSDAAVRMLAQLPDDGTPLPGVVHDVAARARALAAGGTGPPARARVRARTGRYLVVHADVLGTEGADRGMVAVLLEPARPAELAPLIVASAALTAREAEVAALLVGGASTAEIAHRLWISPHTLHDHVKAVFAKLGVTSRAELAALLGTAGGRAGPTGRSLS